MTGDDEPAILGHGVLSWLHAKLPSAVQLLAALFVVVALALGWGIMWLVVLSKLPFVRALCDLPELSQSQQAKLAKRPKNGKSD